MSILTFFPWLMWRTWSLKVLKMLNLTRNCVENVNFVEKMSIFHLLIREIHWNKPRLVTLARSKRPRILSPVFRELGRAPAPALAPTVNSGLLVREKRRQKWKDAPKELTRRDPRWIGALLVRQVSDLCDESEDGSAFCLSGSSVTYYMEKYISEFVLICRALWGKSWFDPL